MNSSPNHPLPPAAPEHDAEIAPAPMEFHAPHDSRRSQSQRKLPELVTLVVLVVATGSGMFWIRDEGERARKTTEARLQAEISRQSKRIESLEANLAEIPKALESILKESFEPILNSAVENRRIAEEAIQKTQASPKTQSERAPTPQRQQRSLEDDFEDAPKNGRVKQVNKVSPRGVEDSDSARLPLMTGDHPNALQPEDIKTKPLQKALRIQRQFEQEMKPWLLDDHTNTTPPQEAGGVYSKGFTK